MARSGLVRFVFSGVLPIFLASLVAVTAVLVLDPPGDDVRLGRLASFVALCGLAAMALIETVKRLLPLRGAYQRRQVTLWLGERVRDLRSADAALGQLVQAMDLAVRELELPAASVDGKAHEDRGARRLAEDKAVGARWRGFPVSGTGVGGAFNLPAEQLTAQVGAATERAVLSPTAHEQLLRALCPHLTREQIGVLKNPDVPQEERAQLAAEMSDQISAAVDQLQIRLNGRWSHYVRTTAWWLAGVFALVIAATEPWLGVGSMTYVLTAQVFGGFFAWLTHDLAVAVERLRR